MKKRNIISLRIVLAVVASAIGLSFLMVPSQEELRLRLFQDSIAKGIRDLIDSGAFGEISEANARFAELPSEQLAFISQLSRLTPRERLRHVINADPSLRYDAFVHYFVTAAVQYVDVIRPDEAFDILSPKTQDIPEPMRAQLLRLLARNALALNDADTALRILRASCANGRADWASMADLVNVERWSNQPKLAHQTLREWLEKHESELEPALRLQVNELLFSLALESGVPDKALTAGLAELRALPASAALPLPLLEQTFKAGEYAGQTTELFPWIERHLHSFKEDQLDWRELLYAHRQGEKWNADYLLWTTRAAQVSDWNTLPEQAWHHHLRLIALGKADSLDRYLPLADYLGRGRETEDLLKALGPVEGREELQLKLARLTAANGDLEEGLRLFSVWVNRHPQDHAARWEYACLVEALSQPEVAIQTFDALLMDFPDDAQAIIRTVALLNRNGRFAEALKHLDNLPTAAFDPDTIEDYVLLAESLDKAPSLLRALRIRIDAAASPSVADYLRVAEVARTSESVESALEALNEAIEALPEVPVLRSQLSAMLLQEARYDESVSAALHSAAWTERDAQLTALSACLHCGRASDVLSALDKNFESEKLAFNTLLDLAVANRQAGHNKHADELFAQVPEVPARYARIAEAHLLAGDFDKAAALAIRNLDSKSKPDANDWILLGDIRHKQGQTDDAQAAYAKAILAVTARLRASTAAIEPPPSTEP